MQIQICFHIEARFGSWCWAEWKRKTLKTFSAVRGCRRFNLEIKFSKLEGTVIVLYKEELNTIPEDEEKNTKLNPRLLNQRQRETVKSIFRAHFMFDHWKNTNLAQNHWITRWRLQPMSCSLGFLLFSWKESKWRLTIVNGEDETYKIYFLRHFCHLSLMHQCKWKGALYAMMHQYSPGYFLLHLKLLYNWCKGVRDDQDHDSNTCVDHFDEEIMLMIMLMITDEENEEAWNDVSDVSPAAASIPGQLHLRIVMIIGCDQSWLSWSPCIMYFRLKTAEMQETNSSE